MLNLAKVLGNSEGIYVRGVRIRSDWADDLYRGNFDNSSTSNNGDGHTLPLKEEDGTVTSYGLEGGTNACCFQHLKSLAGTTWPTALGFNVGNECSWPFFQVCLYQRKIPRVVESEWGLQKDLYTFITSGQSWWRSIYEDQSNGNPPPPLQNESIASLVGYNFYNPDGRGDQIAGRPDIDDFLPRQPWFTGGSTFTGIPPALPGANFTCC